MITTLRRPTQVGLQTSEPRFGSALAIEASGTDPKTLNNWLSRDPAVILLSDEERREAGEKKRFSFDFRRVVQIALTVELVRIGLAPRRAAIASSAFTDSARGVDSDGNPCQRRRPGALFDDGQTALLILPEPAAARVVAVTSGTALMSVLHPERGEAFDSLIFVLVNPLYKRVRRTLGIEG